MLPSLPAAWVGTSSWLSWMSMAYVYPCIGFCRDGDEDGDGISSILKLNTSNL